MEEAGRVRVGADRRGAKAKKELVGFQLGVRESAQSWRELLVDVKRRGLTLPEIGVGDGALGFWKALDEIFPGARHQRCWVHKTANVLNKVPPSCGVDQGRPSRDLRRADPRGSRGRDRRVRRQIRRRSSRGRLPDEGSGPLAFFDFPASVGIICYLHPDRGRCWPDGAHRTGADKGTLSGKTAKSMVLERSMPLRKRGDD